MFWRLLRADGQFWLECDDGGAAVSFQTREDARPSVTATNVLALALLGGLEPRVVKMGSPDMEQMVGLPVQYGKLEVPLTGIGGPPIPGTDYFGILLGDQQAGEGAWAAGTEII